MSDGDRWASGQGPGKARVRSWLRRRRRLARLVAPAVRRGPGDEPGGGLAGVREPRRPKPSPGSDAAALDVPRV